MDAGTCVWMLKLQQVKESLTSKRSCRIHPTLFDLPFQVRFFFLPAQTKGRCAVALFSLLPFMSAFLFDPACPGRSAAHKRWHQCNGTSLWGHRGHGSDEAHGGAGLCCPRPPLHFCDVISGLSGPASTSHPTRTG